MVSTVDILAASGSPCSRMRMAPPRCGARTAWAWLRDHNPPPYLLRALIGTSAAAAHVAAAMARESYLLADQPLETRLAHLESILRTARDALAARGVRF